MRLWTIHPRHLDRQGLLAVWREGLLAQKVLLGKTRGYKHHPQLLRFKEHQVPVAAIATYLSDIWNEATRRGYRFEKKKIHPKRTRKLIPETSGQLQYEWKHLTRKIRLRHGSPPRLYTRPSAHPLFRIIKGEPRKWEKVLNYNREI